MSDGGSAADTLRPLGDLAWPPPLEWPERPLDDGVVRLDRLTEADLDRMVIACSDPATQQWLPLPSPYARADARQFLESRGQAAEHGQELTLAFRGVEEAVLAGVVGLSQRGQRYEAAIGYWSVPDRRRRGWTARAVRLLARHAFATMPLRRIEIFIDPANDASRRVAEAAGAAFECVRRNGMPAPHGGDGLQFSLIPDDFPPSPRRVGIHA